MISSDDKVYITQCLINWIAPVESPRQTLTAPFIGTTFPQQLGQGFPGQLVVDAMRLALVDEWKHDPPWLALLLGLLPEDEKIASIREQLRHPPPPPPDPMQTCILTNGAPFIGRPILRQCLGFLESAASNLKPILVVNGVPKIGKTYSAQFIDHVSYHKPPIYCYRIEFDPDNGLEIGPEQLACELVQQMGRLLNNMPPHNTNQKLYINNLAGWVLSEAMQTPARHWFIIDNFRGEKLRADTRDFLVTLSDLITKGVFPQYCRLILISFDRAQLTVDTGRVEEERIKACTPGEIQAAIAEILKRAPVALDSGLIIPLIMNNLPVGQEKMAELNLRLRALLCVISRVEEILKRVTGVNYQDVLLEMLTNLPDGKDRMTELESRLEDLRTSALEV